MKRPKILVVEDDKVMQSIITGALKSAGYRVVTALDAASATKLARFEEPDLITLDINFEMQSPGDAMDGLQLARWLNWFHSERNTPVIIISGMDPGQLIEEAAAVGAHTFLPKPLDKSALLAAVATALNSKSTEAKRN